MGEIVGGKEVKISAWERAKAFLHGHSLSGV